MSSKQIKNCERICKEIVDQKMNVFASESSLATAKDIQGLRAIFDEVNIFNIKIEIILLISNFDAWIFYFCLFFLCFCFIHLFFCSRGVLYIEDTGRYRVKNNLRRGGPV